MCCAPATSVACSPPSIQTTAFPSSDNLRAVSSSIFPAASCCTIPLYFSRLRRFSSLEMMAINNPFAVTGGADILQLDPRARRCQSLKIFRNQFVIGQMKIRSGFESENGFRSGNRGDRAGKHTAQFAHTSTISKQYRRKENIGSHLSQCRAYSKGEPGPQTRRVLARRATIPRAGRHQE